MKRIQQPSMQEAEQASLNHEILTTWRPGETLGEHMERRGVSRREFNKWCLKMISLMGVATVTGGISNAQEIADKMAALKRPVVVWLQLQECTGCLESTIRSYNEEIGDMVLSAVSMPSVTLPNAAYWPSRYGASSTMMKNCEPAELGIMLRAMESTPRVCLSGLLKPLRANSPLML